MSKYYGTIGYAETVETAPDVWQDTIVEREYYGDIIKDHRKWQNASQLNDNLNISNRISILADPYAYHNCHSIKYATYLGSKWKVTSVEVEYPRLILDLGGVYNEQTGSEPNLP